MPLSSLIAGVGKAIVDSYSFSDARDVAFGDVGVGSVDHHAIVGALAYCLAHSPDKSGTAIGIYRMVTSMVGQHHLLQAPAFSESGRDGKHDAVAKRNYGRLHVVVGIVTFGNLLPSYQKRRLEILSHKLQRDDNMLYAEHLAVLTCTLYLPCIMLGAIVECHSKGYLLLALMQQSGGIHPSAQYYHGILHNQKSSISVLLLRAISSCSGSPQLAKGCMEMPPLGMNSPFTSI